MAEEMKPDHKINRRELLGSALTGAVVLAGCTALGLRDAVAFAKKNGKPLFSAEALNALFPVKLNGDYKKLLTEAQSDPQSFVRNHFTLTPDQEKSLAALTADDLSSLKLGIGTALHEDLRIQSLCGASTKLPAGSQVVAQGTSFQMYKTPNQEVVIQTGTTSKKRVTLGLGGSTSETTGGVEGANSAGGVIFQGTLTLNMMPRSSSE